MSLHRSTLRVVLALGLGLAGIFSLASPASAREAAGTVTFSSLPPDPVFACQAVTSLKAKGDTRIGETAVGTIQVDYSVKPCDNKQAVTVEALVNEAFTPANVTYDDTNAPLDGRFVAGAKYNTTYHVTITVRDAGTGVEISHLTVSAAATTRTTA